MKRIRLGANVAVFVLFFGIATLEAFQTRNWLKAALWLAIGTVVAESQASTALISSSCLQQQPH
jgi:hypothetical protein